MNEGLRRLYIGVNGHYHVPSGPDDKGFCWAAKIVSHDGEKAVNLIVWDHQGNSDKRQDVEFSTPQPSTASFHYPEMCPWDR